MHKQYLATTVYSLNRENVGELPGWFQTNRIAWVFASRQTIGEEGSYMSSVLCPHMNLGPLVLDVQEESPSSIMFKTECKQKILGILAAELLIQIAFISKSKHQNHPKNKTKRAPTQWLSRHLLSHSVLFSYDCQWDYEKYLVFPPLLSLPFTMVHFKSSCPLQLCSKSARFWFCSFRG